MSILVSSTMNSQTKLPLLHDSTWSHNKDEFYPTLWAMGLVRLMSLNIIILSMSPASSQGKQNIIDIAMF
jgi:hypothetical protein